MREVIKEKADEISETGLSGEDMMRIALRPESEWSSQDEIGRCMRFKREV